MTESALDRLTRACGVELSYVGMSGELTIVSDVAKRAALHAMGVAAADDEEVDASLARIEPLDLGTIAAPDGVRCYIPDWLENGRCWGVTCQVYSLRSARNWGIGDFEDLARMAERMAAEGADFVGVNPLHALFLSEPTRSSPFFPSNRNFLNPLYIAVDKVPFHAGMAEALEPPSSSGEKIDYRAVAKRKIEALGYLYRIAREKGDEEPDWAAFETFLLERGSDLYLHALFEALSEAMVAQGHGAGWHGWPEEYREPSADGARAFAEEQADLVTFHAYLQFLAERQLAEVQQRACAAGMRIGLYLDLAVGVAPDGSATWSDRALVVPGARIGAPPDYYNAAGQDWGLAPVSPAALKARNLSSYREALDHTLAYAGALRIDHAMGLYRLFWIAEGLTAANGVYVRYPFADMLRVLAEVSNERRAVVVGEDLGIVPPGFRETMRETEIQGYRVFFFEQQDDRFIAPAAYPREALACVTTHDLHTLAGWWSGHDIEIRNAIGLLADADVDAEHAARADERRRVLGFLQGEGLLPAGLVPLMRGQAEPPDEMPDAFAAALYRAVARAPSRLLAVPAEDLAGTRHQVNIPGTMDEHPNWSRRLPLAVDDLVETPRFRAIVDSLRAERPKP